MLAREIFETPLPDDWDKDIYNDRVPFKTRVEYAKQRAEQVGRGSSRVAFKIKYKGRDTVLKIATNNKGKVQNEEESDLLDDWYVSNLGIVIPLIDYDETSRYPTWIHTEFAQKISQKRLESFFEGVSMRDITLALDSMSGKRRFGYIEIPESLHENENFQMLQDLVLNFDLPAGDFSRAANWGLYKNTPVIIDVGFTDTTAKLYR